MAETTDTEVLDAIRTDVPEAQATLSHLAGGVQILTPKESAEDVRNILQENEWSFSEGVDPDGNSIFNVDSEPVHDIEKLMN